MSRTTGAKGSHSIASNSKLEIISIMQQGSHPIKKCHKKWKKSTRGGSEKNIKKSKIRNLDFLIRGGEAIFSFFSQIQMFTLDTSVEEKIC